MAISEQRISTEGQVRIELAKRSGLKESTIAKITGVFNQHPEVELAILYGSRAKGNYRTGSDIDLALVGEHLKYRMLTRIEDEIDDLLLPYSLDLSILSQINNPNVVDHIHRVGIPFYTRSTKTLEPSS